MDENNIAKDIKRGIEMAFSWFKKNNPSLEQHCDEDILQLLPQLFSLYLSHKFSVSLLY